MSVSAEGPKKGDYEVGYGKPPRSGQFKPGRSGNISGRKRKRDSELDIDDILDQPVEVSAGGKLKAMEPRMVALLAQIRKARSGNLQALAHVIDKLVRHGVLGARKDRQRGGVLPLPNTMPFAMATIIAQHFGRPPWSKAQIAKGREAYLATRTEQQARDDEAIGYPDL
ncbi:DUF5681 domain-containing protein [Novosphingobium sp. PY1]|uniref:DUF5681 domain-containing protein n=1 Tax=Novosphingobium sp. PY1 TaxID=1882221 RepID=UPI001A9091A5|nr:DUF5681 domain-containing protein [Novosphingobium sp. PY1]GFM28596.1 uncharacterized protein PY1_contig-04-644 [Novosphingobium sp. PY1]